MSPVFSVRRSADEFHALIQGGELSDAATTNAKLVRELELVGALREVAAPSARPDFVTDLRSALMAEAEVVFADAPKAVPATRPALPPRNRKRDRRVAVAVGGVAILGATSGVAFASQDALPGEPLYPVKRTLENVRAAFASDDSKGVSMLTNASGRLAEVDALARTGDNGDAVQIERTLGDFIEQAETASALLVSAYEDSGRTELIDEVRAFTQSSEDMLNELAPMVPAEARATLVEAGEALRGIAQQAMNACPECAPIVTDGLILSTATGLEDLATIVLPPAPEAPPAQDAKKSGTKKSDAVREPAPEKDEDSVSEPEAPDTPKGPEQPTVPKAPEQNTQQPDNPVEDLLDGLRGANTGSGDQPKLPKPPKSIEDTIKDLTGL